MSRVGFGLIGAVMVLFPDQIRTLYGTLAYENPEGENQFEWYYQSGMDLVRARRRPRRAGTHGGDVRTVDRRCTRPTA